MKNHTPYNWLREVAHSDPDRVCIVTMDGDLSYSEVLESVRERAAALSLNRACCQSGCESTEIEPIVPTMVENTAETVIELLALQLSGAVPLPYVLDPPDLSEMLARGVAGRGSTEPGEHWESVSICVSTSGSGGAPRIVPLTYENIEHSVVASQERIGNDSTDRWLLCLPLNHVGGLSIIWRSLHAGGAVIVTPFDSVVEAICELRPTIASMVPTMVHRLLIDEPSVLASIQRVLTGGAALTVNLLSRASEAGVTLTPTYGMTEASSQIATVSNDDIRREPGHVGRPLRGFEVTILNHQGVEVESGTVGRIAVDGKALFHGYLGGERAERPFVTNDMGWMTNEGGLHIVGRSDDVIVTGGEKVSISHVAEVLEALGGVEDVCVVPIGDPEWGTIIAAMVVSEVEIDSSATIVRELLEPAERPKYWLTVAEIPKLHNHKHDVIRVIEAFKAERSRLSVQMEEM